MVAQFLAQGNSSLAAQFPHVCVRKSHAVWSTFALAQVALLRSMLYIRSIVLGLSAVIFVSTISVLQSSRVALCESSSVRKQLRSRLRETPVTSRIGSCFAQNRATALQELDDAYLLSRGLSHLGTLRALNFSLTRAVERGELRIGVTGGSVSVGGACYDEPDKMWFNYMRSEISSKLKDVGLNLSVTLLNIAQGATGPERAFFCGKELLNDAQLDLLILEYAINESGGTFSELLVRQATKQSAVMFVETFSIRDEREGFKSAQMGHDVLARYYDVPIISARDAFRDAFRRDQNILSEYFSADRHHPSCCGHLGLGGLAAAVISLAIDAFLVPHEHTPLSSSYSRDTLPPFLDISNVNLPRYIIERAPNCMLAASRLSEVSQSSWHKESMKKPTFDCTSPEDGNFSVTVNCDAALFQDGDEFCQVIVFYTRSWQPIGDARIFVNDAVQPSVQLIGFVQSWRDAGYQWTIQQMTSLQDASLRIRAGVSTLNIQCTGTTQAPDEFESAFQRTLFQLHGLVVI